MASAFGTETVLDVRHWTDDYFSFTTTRDDGFRFDNGQFVMIGLDLTLQAMVTDTIKQRMLELGKLGRDLVVPLATFWNDPQDPNWGGQAVHDVCAVAYVSRPDLFTTVPARVEVETEGRWTAGMTVTDFRSSIPNASVAVKIDVDGFWDYVLECYGRVAAQRNG